MEHFCCQELGLGIKDVGLHHVCTLNLDSREIDGLRSRGPKRSTKTLWCAHNAVELVINFILWKIFRVKSITSTVSKSTELLRTTTEAPSSASVASCH